MILPQLFLVAPDLPPDHIVACAKGTGAACVVVPNSFEWGHMHVLQQEGMAVLFRSRKLGSDGVHVDAANVAAAQKTLSMNMVLGAFCGTSRDLAMMAGEAGAAYLAFSQKSQKRGEPIVYWASEMMQLPVVAFDPVSPQELAMLLPQEPDFIRPMDTMWDNPAASRETIRALMEVLSQ